MVTFLHLSMDEVNFGYHGHENYKDKGISKVLQKEKKL
jgi:hypothetical protein